MTSELRHDSEEYLINSRILLDYFEKSLSSATSDENFVQINRH